MPDALTPSWRRVLFVRTDRLGETLLTLPAVLEMKAALPGSEITLLVHPALRELVQRVCGIQAVWAYPPGQRQFWLCRAVRWAKRLRQGRFDAVIISNPMKELHLAAWLSGIPVRAGYNRKWGCLLTRRMADDRASGLRHEVESNKALIHFAGAPVGGELPVAWGLEKEEKAVASMLERQGIDVRKPYVVVHPWASHPKKEWLPQCFHELIRELRVRHGLAVVVVGQPGPGGLKLDWVAGAPESADLTAQLTLPQLAALLRRAVVLVSSDSGPVHLAAAVGAPTVALFGTADAAAGPARWGPWGNKHAVIWKPSMGSITVDEVLEAVMTYAR